MLGATNNVKNLDPAMIRAGRFDRTCHLSLPSIDERERLFALYARNLRTAGELDFRQLARLSTGLSPASIAYVVNAAALQAGKEDADAVTHLHLHRSLEQQLMGAVFAHNVHPTTSELDRLSYLSAGVAYCPCSNAALGSGFFPVQRHLRAGVRFALGTDCGAGTGLGMWERGTAGVSGWRDLGGYALTPDQLLYLSTRAGAELLGMDVKLAT